MPQRPFPFQEETEVPRRVAICPYCGGTLFVSADEWEELASGRMKVTGITTQCANEPVPEDQAWDDWWEIHRQMPYVYQLPVDEKILRWLQRPSVARRYAVHVDSTEQRVDREGTDG